MRSMKVLGVTLCVLVLGALAFAGANNLAIHEANRVTFVAPIRVGTTLLPAGEYVVRHTMEGQEHIMVFQSANRKGPETRAKCSLVPLPKKADRTTTSFQVNAANERVLQELVFAGENAKHVF